MSLLKGFLGRQIDITIKAGRGHDVRILERPGRWMAPDDLQDLARDLRTVAAKTLPARTLTYGVFSGDPEAFQRTIVTLVRTNDGHPVAFNALAVMDVDLGDGPDRVLHLGLVMVDPDQQSRGLSWVLYGLTCVLLFVRGRMRPLWISNVTQVPAIVGMVSETFSNVFPCALRPDGRSLRHLLLARAIMSEHRSVFGVGADAGFDEDRFVITNAYTGGSDALKKRFEEAPQHRDGVHNRFCADRLDYDRGDDVLQIGQIDLAAASRYLLKTVPPASLLGLAATAGLLLLQRAVLPVIQWFDTSQRFGDLRARG